MDNETLQRPQLEPGKAMPGTMDSVLLVFDAAGTLLRLAQEEGRQWLHNMPRLLLLELYRLPVLLLAWIAFGVLFAVAVHDFSGSPVLAALAFFLLQVALAGWMQRISRRLRAQMRFRETREGIELLRASLRDRLQGADKA